MAKFVVYRIKNLQTGLIAKADVISINRRVTNTRIVYGFLTNYRYRKEKNLVRDM